MSPSAGTDSVRLAWPSDARDLAEVQRRVWLDAQVTASALEESFGDLDEHAGRWAATLGRSPEARFRVLVAVRAAGEVVGYAIVHPGADPDADPVRDAELGDLAVDPRARRGGHASRLLQAGIDTAKADGFSLARTWIASGDDAGRTLLVSAGWAPDGAHRELEASDGRRIRQVRLHTQIA
ncbi:MAG: GNAT family N-acetyltransferase [Aeromicrobium sp.]|uniref:GNAT family N-acetyltransferase n=1 Tax=Aeromicrobium sp. TaxID=1871063 RepID=UPI0039E60000